MSYIPIPNLAILSSSHTKVLCAHKFSLSVLSVMYSHKGIPYYYDLRLIYGKDKY